MAIIYVSDVNLERCSSATDIDISYTGAVNGFGLYDCGGFCGESRYAPANYTDCYAIGDVSCLYAPDDSGQFSFEFGGFCGNSASMENCYYAGDLIFPPTATNVGGLVGGQSGGEADTSNYWDTEVSGYVISAAGTGKTTAQMKHAATFSGWDFVNVWNIVEDVSYPFLRSAFVAIRDWCNNTNAVWFQEG
jgi:hypothetical protein